MSSAGRRVATRVPSPDELAKRFASHRRVEFPALPGRRNHLRTGVLVPLVWTPEPECIVTVRAAQLRHHAGEVCFPGGRPDASDADLRATALREAREELGMVDARVLGELSSIPLYTSDFRLHPFVAAVDGRPLEVNAAEVADVIRIPLRGLLERDAVEAIPWQAGDFEGLSPVFELGTHRMYGATAHAFYELLCVVAESFGLSAPALVPGSLTWSDVLPSP